MVGVPAASAPPLPGTDWRRINCGLGVELLPYDPVSGGSHCLDALEHAMIACPAKFDPINQVWRGVPVHPNAIKITMIGDYNTPPADHRVDDIALGLNIFLGESSDTAADDGPVHLSLTRKPVIDPRYGGKCRFVLIGLILNSLHEHQLHEPVVDGCGGVPAPFGDRVVDRRAKGTPLAG